MKEEEKIHISIALIEQKMDFMCGTLESIDGHLKKQNGKINSHGKKISWILGAGGGSVALLGALQYFQ